MPGSPASRPVTTTGAPKPPAPRAAGAIIRPTARPIGDRRLFMEGCVSGGGGADAHVQIASIGEPGGGDGAIESRPWLGLANPAPVVPRGDRDRVRNEVRARHLPRGHSPPAGPVLPTRERGPRGARRFTWRSSSRSRAPPTSLR